MLAVTPGYDCVAFAALCCFQATVHAACQSLLTLAGIAVYSVVEVSARDRRKYSES